MLLLRSCVLLGLLGVMGCAPERKHLGPATTEFYEKPDAQKDAGKKPGHAEHTIAHAGLIEILRVGSLRIAANDDAKLDQPTIGGYPIVSIITLDEKTSRDLRVILLDDKNYNSHPPAACIFSPGIAFRLVGQDEAIELLVCFDCGDLARVEDGQLKATIPFRTEKFVAMAKEIYRHDPAIQALKHTPPN
ncbi:MAG: hypothetical protein JSS27_14715 [Planctomycetes bacterium]|nr:hypothetical protein [Planctomycetota bacterium]